MTTDNTQLTPAENRLRAGQALNRTTGVNPVSPLYQNLTLTAITHALLEIGSYLDVLIARTEPPQIPGLPPGYALATEQATENDRKWRYVLTAPDGKVTASPYRWGYSETALAEGIRHAAIDRAALGGTACAEEDPQP
jgi:hypothetical protein